MKLPGGMDANAVKFRDDLRAVALELMPHARLVVKLPDEAERGSRFNDNAGVLWRLESMFDADDFAIDPINTINAALIDAAKSDWYYSHEKDYGHDNTCGCNACEPDDYESESDAC